MARTTYGDISQRTAAWVAKEMLSHADHMVVLSKYGLSKPIPKNTADNVKFRRPVPFTISTTPVAEGITPSPQTMSYEDVSCSLLQYGASVMITDKVADMNEDPVLKDAAMLCGEQAGETLEMLVYGVVKAGTNVFYSTGTARTSVDAAMSLNLQRAVTRSLKANRAKKISQRLASSPNYNTEPVDAAFFAFGHTDLEADLRGLTGWVPIEKYAQMKPEPFEVGKLEDVRYILAPHFAPYQAGGVAVGVTGMIADDDTNIDVYPIIFIAKEAFATVTLKGASGIAPTVIQASTIDKSDPLGQRGYVSWKTYFAAVILNQSWMAVAEVAATDL